MMQFAANPRLKLAMYFAAAVLAVAVLYWVPAKQEAQAQTGGAPAAAEGGPSSTAVPSASTGEETPAAAKKPSKSIDIFALAIAGGIFMIPILGMSILAATMTIERFLGLRKQRVLPEGLVTGLGSLGGAQGNFDPRKAWPQYASNIVRIQPLPCGHYPAEQVPDMVYDEISAFFRD